MVVCSSHWQLFTLPLFLSCTKLALGLSKTFGIKNAKQSFPPSDQFLMLSARFIIVETSVYSFLIPSFLFRLFRNLLVLSHLFVSIQSGRLHFDP